MTIVGPMLPGESLDDWAAREAAKAPPLTAGQAAFIRRAMGDEVAPRLAALVADMDLGRSA